MRLPLVNWLKALNGLLSTRRKAVVVGLFLPLLLSCATAIEPATGEGSARLKIQNKTLNPGNGGVLASADNLQPGDIILTADNGINSLGIRLITQSPVSHAAIYMGNEQVAEAVGSGIRMRSIQAFLTEEATVVAFRHPGVNASHFAPMQAFVNSKLGQKYNYVGVVLQAPFAMERKVCELPLVTSLVRDFCIRGLAAIQLGLGRNDQFFCSQFVLEAFKVAGVPLTDADPLLISPGDLLHMREGDVPSVRIHQKLDYIGHLKSPPLLERSAQTP